jgi:poly-gamma-glutamate synthase PgsB/CapB
VPLLLALSLALLACGLAENLRHQRNLRRIPIRILVNGTRGKSSVTRLIAGMLREAGYTTIAKATGSEARIILEDGRELPVARPFGARITEQKALARLAASRGAQALVVECMAVRPESQLAMRTQLVRPTITVITNARVDHVDEMGPSLADTAESLALTIAPDACLVTSDPRFAGAARRVALTSGSSVGPETLARFAYPVVAENLELALAVGAELGIDREVALRGMVKAEPDVGALGIYRVEPPSIRAYVVVGFAANDLASTVLVWKAARSRLPPDLPLVLLFNNRADREYRIGEFLDLPAAIGPLRLVAVCGDYPKKVARLFARRGEEALSLDKGLGSESALEAIARRVGSPFVLFGVGNFKGLGEELAALCRRSGVALLEPSVGSAHPIEV